MQFCPCHAFAGLDDGCIDLDTNPVERAIRAEALGRKNRLFSGVTAARCRWGTLESAKLNNIEPDAYIADVLQRMIDGHPANRLDELLPWNWTPQHAINS